MFERPPSGGLSYLGVILAPYLDKTDADIYRWKEPKRDWQSRYSEEQGLMGGKRVPAGMVLIVFALCLGYAPAASAASCPNETFRTGSSAALPDCRAYELVSPPDSNGRLLEALNTFGLPGTSQLVPNELASPTRDSIAFLSYQSALPEPKGATGVADLYEAEREGQRWNTTRRLTLSGSETRIDVPGGFSPDHLYSLSRVIDVTSPLIVEKQSTIYLTHPDGSFEILGLGSLDSEPFAQGRYLGEGGEHIVFSTGDAFSQSIWCQGNPKCEVNQLEPNAPPTGTGAVYDRSADGPTQVVSLLPGDTTPAAGEQALWKGTSKDASATAFEIKGGLYVRLDNEETKEVAAGEPLFAGVSDDGRYVFYVVPASGEAGVIHRFDTETEADVEVNPGNEGTLVNISADGSHVYFISEAQIGGKGMAGQPNLYVWSGTSPEYITTVAASDLDHTSGEIPDLPALDNWTGWVMSRPKNNAEQGPGASSTRTSPDGSVLVFESKAQLTSYDNDGHTEIYRYADADDSLSCISCNPLAEPATKDARLQDLVRVPNSTIVHNLTADGSRVFFETTEAMVEADIDGVNDIYQWSEDEEGGGNSLALISSGQSIEMDPLDTGIEASYVPLPNILLSVTPDGKDVVFISQDVLAPGAPEGGAAQIYDARMNGGFPAPTEPIVCVEEDCKQPASQFPFFLPPTSESLQGSGNVKPKPRKPHCRRAKHKKHRHCKGKAKARRTRAHASVGIALAGGQQAVPSVTADSFSAQPKELPQGAKEGVPASIQAENPENSYDYGIEGLGAELSSTAAAMHPDFKSTIALNHFFNENGTLNEEGARTEEVAVSLPAGLVGNPNAIPKCTTGQLVAFSCPIASQVGIAKVRVTWISGNPADKGKLTEPLYNLRPPHPNKELARFGFVAAYPVFIDIKVRTASDYGVTATVQGPSGLVSLVIAETTLWGNPADPVHDKLRLTPKEANFCSTACEAPGGERSSGIEPEDRKAFMINPSACQEMEMGVAVKSYQLPGDVFTASTPFEPGPITGCEGLPFDPSFTATPTNPTAGAPTGLKTTLQIPQHEGEEEAATATMREAKVTLPEGMTIAAGAADGLAACSDEEVGYHEEVDANCPDASKLGVATITSPALPKPLQGTLYQRTPEEGRLFGLWLVTDDLGLHVKLPGEIEADKETGHLTAVFTDLPQVPVSQIEINVWGGDRAPLKNPDSCGTYETSYTFTPHSNDPAVSGSSQMTIDQGCNTGGFSPRLSAGATNPVAGAFSPFVFDITRQDGEQNLSALQITLPEGELAKLAGVPLCPDEAAAIGACPAASQIGRLNVAVGPGPAPLWLPQPGRDPTAVYLGGPYKSAPFSVITVVPAQAGPFDLGAVVVRSALDVDPVTAQAIVKTDPLPQFIEGVAAIYRRVHVVVDRPGFSLNPTDCSEMQVTSTLTSAKGAIANPASRFQVDGCKALGFKPKLSLRLKGGTKRGDYPALSATVKARPGDANIGRVSVALPHSAFLAQEHIQTICTRVRFAANTCPKGSVYGRAKAWTPLLDQPLEGPVYLRSSDNPLPDLVMALKGQIEVNLVGRIDSHNEGIRTTFDRVPDAPVTKFVLRMRGGKKSLLVNSTDLCKGRHRSTVRMRGQNGRRADSRPVLRSGGCKKKKP